MRPVKKPLFTVPLRDVEYGEKTLQWDIPSSWFDEFLADTEAGGRGIAGYLEAYLKKNGNDVYVKGQVKAALTMPCARSLKPVDVDIETEIVLLLAPRPLPEEETGPGKKGQRQRKRRSEDNEDELLSTEMAAQDFFDGETIVLDEFVREHLLLELPLFPVRSDLPFEPVAATDTPPDEAEREERPLDPRLAPLAALARQMQKPPKE